MFPRSRLWWMKYRRIAQIPADTDVPVVAPATYYLLTEAGDGLATEASDSLRTE